MELDFRVDAGIIGNQKIQRLLRRLGDTGFRCLVQMWAYVRQHSPAGVLIDVDDEGLAIAAGWPADRPLREFIDAFAGLRFIEKAADGVSWQVHDWQIANPWSAASPGRQAFARQKNHDRWHVRRRVVDPACALCTSQSGIAVSSKSLTEKELSVTDVRSESVGESIPSVPHHTAPHRKSGGETLSGSQATPDHPCSDRKTRTFDERSIEMELATLLATTLEKSGRAFTRPKDLQAWARTFSEVLDIDKRDASQVRAVVSQIPINTRLSTYLRSPGALRAKWPDDSAKWDSFIDEVEGKGLGQKNSNPLKIHKAKEL